MGPLGFLRLISFPEVVFSSNYMHIYVAAMKKSFEQLIMVLMQLALATRRPAKFLVSAATVQGLHHMTFQLCC